MAPITKSERVPKPMQATFDAIVALSDAFCRAHLDEEYAQLARQATAALCRKRPSPLATGNPKTWACGIGCSRCYLNPLIKVSIYNQWLMVSDRQIGIVLNASHDKKLHWGAQRV